LTYLITPWQDLPPPIHALPKWFFGLAVHLEWALDCASGIDSDTLLRKARELIAEKCIMVMAMAMAMDATPVSSLPTKKHSQAPHFGPYPSP
jgi:hypothetical protein